MIFRHTITLYAAAITESEFGGLQSAFPATGTTFSAFVQHRTENRDIINDTAGSRATTVIYVLGTCPAKPLDRITFDGKTYEVEGATLARSPDAVHHTKVLCYELDQTGK